MFSLVKALPSSLSSYFSLRTLSSYSPQDTEKANALRKQLNVRSDDPLEISRSPHEYLVIRFPYSVENQEHVKKFRSLLLKYQIGHLVQAEIDQHSDGSGDNLTITINDKETQFWSLF